MKQQNKLSLFSRDLKLSFHMNQNQSPNFQEMSNQKKTIYILQTIKVEQHEYSLFYDTGCCDMVSRYVAIKSIGKRASKEFSGPVTLGGVDNAQITSNHGTYQVKLPLFNGNNAVLSSVCLDQITVEFPKDPLKGHVEADIRSGYISNGKDPKYLPKLLVFVGGHTDFMIGVKRMRYYPEKVLQLPSGLTIYKSWFKNADGTRGVIGGPHRVFTENKSSYQVNVRSFLSDQYNLFKSGYQMNPDASMLHVKFKKDHLNDAVVNTYQFNNVDEGKRTQSFENTGIEITYRCNKSRNCKVCKKHSTDEIMSVKGKVE